MEVSEVKQLKEQEMENHRLPEFLGREGLRSTIKSLTSVERSRA
jgi:hypothetical protein